MRRHVLAALVAAALPALTPAMMPGAAFAETGQAGAVAGPVVVTSAATPRPGVPLRNDVYAGKYQATGAAGQRVPRGYRPVWDDGRLNPHRGPRAAAGDAAMLRLWTDAAPMELVQPAR